MGPPLVYLNEQYDFTWIETNLYAILGGMLGVFVFMHISEWLIELWDRIRLFYYRKRKRKKGPFSPPVADIDSPLEIKYEYVEHAAEIPKRKLFTRRNRRVVRIWKRYGLIGLAALTPIIFSIPIGTFFMTKLEKNKQKIFMYMLASICSWSLILTTIFEILQIRSLPEILQ